MDIKIFVLGRPGSGKSTSARYIEQRIRDKVKGCPIFRICDYDILYQMFKADVQQKMFHSTKYGGFDIHDLNVFDIALGTLESDVERRIREESLSNEPLTERLVIIEFARDDYANALNQFNEDFYKDAYFLFLDVDVSVCLDRIRERTAHPVTPDDHYVSEHIFDVYYHKDDKEFIRSRLLTKYGVSSKKVSIINNRGSFEDLSANLDRFIDALYPETVCISSSKADIETMTEQLATDVSYPDFVSADLISAYQ